MQQSNQERNEEIRTLRKQGMKLRELGQKYNVSFERIRQICLEKKFCDVHQRTYSGKFCEICNITTNYSDILSSNPDLLQEISNLSQRGRTMEIHLKRVILVQKLWKLGFSKTFIAKLLKRHHTTIMHLLK